MKVNYFKIAFLCFFLSNCNSSSRVENDEDDSSSESNTTESNDTGTESNDTGTENNDTGTENNDTDSEISQKEVTISLVNNTNITKYVIGIGHYVFCYDSNEDSCQMNNPYCMFSCEEIEENDYCLILCAPPLPSVKILEPGESIEIIWDGFFKTVDDNLCSDGSCFWRSAPPAGNYTLRTTVYDDYSCEHGQQCENINGSIQWASVSGEATTYSKEITLPYHDESFVILIE
jgi:hypothetical protein